MRVRTVYVSQRVHGSGGDFGGYYRERSGGFGASDGTSDAGRVVSCVGAAGAGGGAGTIVCTGGVVVSGTGILFHTSQSAPNWRKKRSEKERKKTGTGNT